MPNLISKRSECVLSAWKTGDKRYRVLVCNGTHAYYNSEIRMPFSVKGATFLNKSRNHSVTVRKGVLYEKVYPRGTSIMEIEEE